jgi:phage terminase large subunit-like protein
MARLLALRDQYEREGLGRDWYSQYQCRPRPPEGAMFRPGEMRLLDVPPVKLWRTVRAWDLASTTSGDWTVGLKLSQYSTPRNENAWIIADVRRMRGRPDEVRALFHETVKTDRHGVVQWLPQDPGAGGCRSGAVVCPFDAGLSD